MDDLTDEKCIETVINAALDYGNACVAKGYDDVPTRNALLKAARAYALLRSLAGREQVSA